MKIIYYRPGKEFNKGLFGGRNFASKLYIIGATTKARAKASQITAEEFANIFEVLVEVPRSRGLRRGVSMTTLLI